MMWGAVGVRDGRCCPDVGQTVAAVAAARPDLVAAVRAAVPGARAAVLARLWGALAREPVVGVAGRRVEGDRLVVTFDGGAVVRGPVAAAEPFASVVGGLRLWVGEAAVEDPAVLLAGLGLPGGGPVVAELANSVANLALARGGREVAVGGAGGRVVVERSLVGWEQVVVDGHPLHPGCRTRVGMSTAEVLAYAPEHAPVVELELVEVPRGRWLSTGAGLAPVLPVHPWQRDHVLGAFGWLRRTGRRVVARPLLSLRTVVPVDGPVRQVKTAVDVRMTSAVRTVSAAAVRNGPVVTGLLSELARSVPGLSVLPEVAAGAVLVDGEPCRSLAVVVRGVPVAAGAQVLPLAALAAPVGAVGGPPVVAGFVRSGFGGDPVAFVGRLARVVLEPVLTLLWRGVALEAHGQNVLVVVRSGRPVGVWYRDVGGVRVSARRLAACGVAVPAVHGDLACEDPVELRRTVFAAVGVALGEQVAVLAREFGVAPGRLWEAVGRVVRVVVAGAPVAVRDDVEALFAAVVPVKAMLAMRLAADPLVVRWAWVPNPLAGLR